MLFEEEEFLIISSRWQEEGGVCLMDMSFGPLLSWSIGFYFLGKKIIIKKQNLPSKLKVSLHSKKIVLESMKCEIWKVFSVFTQTKGADMLAALQSLLDHLIYWEFQHLTQDGALFPLTWLHM